MEDNNIIEFFMTKSGFEIGKFFYNWEKVSIMLLGNCLQYFTNGNNFFVGQNLGAILNKCKTGNMPVNAIQKADVTEDIGLLISKVHNPFINPEKMEFLFIENEFSTALCAGVGISDENGKFLLAYEYDLQKQLDYNKEKQEKMIKLFKNSIVRYNNFIEENKEKYNEITKYYNKRLNT